MSNKVLTPFHLDEVLQLWDQSKDNRNEGSQLIIIADSCYSGAWVAEINQRRDSNIQRTAEAVENVSMAASCEPDETCYETEDGGDFTMYPL